MVGLEATKNATSSGRSRLSAKIFQMGSSDNLLKNYDDLSPFFGVENDYKPIVFVRDSNFFKFFGF